MEKEREYAQQRQREQHAVELGRALGEGGLDDAAMAHYRALDPQRAALYETRIQTAQV